MFKTYYTMMSFLETLLIHQRKALSNIKKREELKDAVDKNRLYKWTHRKIEKVSNEIINKTYAEYKQREVNEKGEKTGKALGKHVINIYSSGISRMVKIRDVKKLRQDIENDPIIQDQMTGLACLLVCTFGSLLAPVLVLARTVNNLDLGDEQGYENEGYKSDLKV